MKGNTKKITIAVIAMLCVTVLVVGGYFFITNNAMNFGSGSNKSSSEIEKLMAKDLETQYPDTPDEVVKFYWRINKCMYNEKMDDSEFEALLKQLRLLYDEEFLNQEENSWKNMLSSFKEERDSYQDKKNRIVHYAINPKKRTEYNEKDKKEYAIVHSYVVTKQKAESKSTNEKFLCSKDDKGNWKIVGWELDSDD